MGIAWKVPVDVHEHTCEDGEILRIGFLHPRRMIEYLVEKYPRVLFGTPSIEDGQHRCAAYWKAYRGFHPGHEIFSMCPDTSQLQRVLPIAVHGDEGRGKRRSNTTVVSWEAVLGVKGHTSVCRSCMPATNWFSCHDSAGTRKAKSLTSNMKSHSFLQHFPSFMLPGTMDKKVLARLVHEMLVAFADQLADLFHTGFQFRGHTWRIAVTGAKGDLKWHSKVGRLCRGFEHKSTTRDVCQCHWCHAGKPGEPAEEQTANPAWSTSLFADRPWHAHDPSAFLSIPFDNQKPEFLLKMDGFHCLKLGLFRHFLASSIMLVLRLGFFGRQGTVAEKLNGAWGHFKMWQLTSCRNAALRSFSPALFNYQTKQSYPWINCKASDTMLCMRWMISLSIAVLNGNDRPLDQQQAEALQIILSLARLGIRWFDIVFNHGLWLSRPCASCLYEVGLAFTKGYAKLSAHAWATRQCLYALVPKFHFQLHTLHELKMQLNTNAELICSPIHWDCCQNEDLIGRMSRLSRRIDGRIVTTRSLEFYLIKAHVLLKRHFGD